MSEETGEGQWKALHLFLVYAMNGFDLDNFIPIHQTHSYCRKPFYRCARICRTEQRDATLSFRPRFAVQHGARISGYEMPGGSRYGQDRQ
ncbi:hypothetical protein F3B56_29595 [Bacteroides ovatus]|nr:hypothetical protein F3B56_29595 [Bacteroides ovatus]